MAIERIIDTSHHHDDADEQIIEVTLRPQSFDDYVGQERLKKNLKLSIDAAKKRGEPMDHRHRLQTVKPYAYEDAATLLADFWQAVDAVLKERGVI